MTKRSGKRCTGWLAGTAALLLAGFASPAQAADEVATKPVDTNAEIKALKDRLEALEAKQKAEQSAVRIDKALTDVTKDAGTRSQLVSPILAEYNLEKGVQIRSQDGNFTFHPNLQFMFRSVTNYREDIKGGGTEEDIQNGFEVRRMKFGFDGTAGADLKYNFLWATNRKTGNPVLEEAYVIYKLGDFGLPNPISVQAGALKNYFAHESMSSSKRLFAAERTLLNDLFTGGDNFVEGAGVLYNEGTKGGPLRAGVLFNNGSNNVNTNFQDFPTTKWDWGAAARVDFKLFGNWVDYEDFTARGIKDALLVFGGGLDYSEAGDFAQFMQTVDVQYKAGPFSAYAAFLGRSLRHAGIGGAGTGTANPATAGSDNFYDYGVLAKLGWMLDPKFELFGQGSYIRFDSGEFAAGVESTVYEITFGTNYYFRGHSAKFTADFTWLPNGSPVANDGGGILASPNGENQYVFRIQFQLLI